MADPTTWIDVAHDAVKIGLGAIIGGGISIVIAMIARHQENLKSFVENKRKHIESITDEVGQFTEIFNIFWADVRNIIDDKANGKEIYPKREKLKETEKKLYQKFPLITKNLNRLIIIGEKNASNKLTAFGKKCDEFYRYADLDDDITGEKSDEYKKEIERLRHEFFEEMRKSYENLHIQRIWPIS